MKMRIMMPILLLVALLLQGCGSSASTNEDAGDTGIGNEVTSLRVINSKGEVTEQMGLLADEFNRSQDAIQVEIETIPAGANVQSTLKGYYLADNTPDIIVCEAASFDKWEGLLEDLSGETWVSDTDAAYVDETYGTLGFPYTTEAIGLAYNADILKKAGIDPASLTGPDAYRAAFAKLDGMKKSLGLTAVVGYCAEDSALYWSTGNHIFGTYLDSGLDRDDTTYIDLIKEGKLDKERFTNYANFIGLLNRYSDPNLLTSGTYDEQVKNFASGKYAFVTQGSWIGSTLTGADADAYKSAGSFEIGMAPYAFEDGMDTIQTNSPSWWAVMKEGHPEAAKEFLSWCASDAGQKIFVEQAGFISPYKSCSYIATDPFAAVISSYLTQGKTSAWHWMDLKEGMAQFHIAPVFYNYAAGRLDANGFADAIQAAVQDVYGK